MAKYNPPGQLPVSQRQLAIYLGISPSLMNMAAGRQLSRNLPAGSLQKLAALEVSHDNIKKSKRPQRSLLKPGPEVARQADVLIDKMSMAADYYGARAKVLQRKLDAMISKQQEDIEWLNTIDQKLLTFRTNKEPRGDYHWFQNQHTTVSERLIRSSIVMQVKLKLEIELAKATAGINRSLVLKLRKEIK
jgi:hypothetical protein